MFTIDQRLVSWFLLLPAISTLVVMPLGGNEAISLPKFTVFTSLAFYLFVLSFRAKIFLENSRVTLISITLLIISIITIIINKNNISEQLYGVYGRNNGFLMFFSSIVFFLAGIMILKGDVSEQLIKNLRLTSILVSSYLVIQILKLDPIGWTDLYGIPTSTLGNPNFVSALLSIGVIVQAREMILRRKSLKSTIISSVTLSICIVGLWKMDSLQGWIMVLAALFVYVALEIKIRFFPKHFSKYSSITVLVFGIIIFLIMNYLFQNIVMKNETFGLRISYWQAGLRMINSSPIIGNGFDSYLYYFDQFKPEEFGKKYGSVVSSSAHNLYIDLFVNAGVIVGLLYCLLNCIIGFSVIKLLFKFNKRTSESIVSLSILWIMLQIQNLISVPNVPLIAWQWCIAAIIYRSAFDIKKLSREELSKDTSFRASKKESLQVAKIQKKIAVHALAITFSVFTCLSLFQDMRFGDAIRSQDGTKILEAVRVFPYDTYRLNYSAKAFQESKYWYWSKELAKLSVENNPRNAVGFELLIKNPISSKAEKMIYSKKISQLRKVRTDN